MEQQITSLTKSPQVVGRELNPPELQLSHGKRDVGANLSLTNLPRSKMCNCREPAGEAEAMCGLNEQPDNSELPKSCRMRSVMRAENIRGRMCAGNSLGSWAVTASASSKGHPAAAVSPIFWGILRIPKPFLGCTYFHGSITPGTL